MNRKLRIGVVTGSTRPNRLGEKIAAWFLELAKKREGLELVPLDLRDYPLPLYDQPKSPKVIERDYPTEPQRKWVEAVSGLDGFVLVTPEYNHAPPASLKNALDHVYAGWNAKPVAFVSYGGVSGGIRAVQQLRQIAVELQLTPLREEVNIPLVFRPLDAEGKPSDPFFATKAEALLDSLSWWALALAEAREKHGLPGAPKK